MQTKIKDQTSKVTMELTQDTLAILIQVMEQTKAPVLSLVDVNKPIIEDSVVAPCKEYLGINFQMPAALRRDFSDTAKIAGICQADFLAILMMAYKGLPIARKSELHTQQLGSSLHRGHLSSVS